MRNWPILLMTLLLSAALLFTAGCMEEDPFYTPQGIPSGGGAGPSGTSAFSSGEASKTGLTPVKEGALVTPDVVEDTGNAAEDVQDEDTGYPWFGF